jgi:ATP-dependent protease HslVU (ClpYQ) peptidase subunit
MHGITPLQSYSETIHSKRDLIFVGFVVTYARKAFKAVLDIKYSRRITLSEKAIKTESLKIANFENDVIK